MIHGVNFMLLKDKLKELRKNKNLSQEQVAKLLLVSRSTYAKWENGLRIPQNYYLENLAKIYKIEITDFFDIKDTKILALDVNSKLNKLIFGFMLTIIDLIIILSSILYFFKIYSTNCIDLLNTDKGAFYITYSLSDMNCNYYPLISLIINFIFIILTIFLYFSYNKKFFKIFKILTIIVFFISITFIVLAFLSGRFMLAKWLADNLLLEV